MGLTWVLKWGFCGWALGTPTLKLLSIRSADSSTRNSVYELGFLADASNFGEGNLIFTCIGRAKEHPLADASNGFGGNRLIVYVPIYPRQATAYLTPWPDLHGPVKIKPDMDTAYRRGPVGVSFNGTLSDTNLMPHYQD